MAAGPDRTETFSQQLMNKECLKITYATCNPCDLMVRPISEGATTINHRTCRNKGSLLLLVLIVLEGVILGVRGSGSSIVSPSSETCELP